MGGRLLYAGHGWRGDTGYYRGANGLHTRITVLPHDGGQTGRSGQVAEEAEKLRRGNVQERAGTGQTVRRRRKVSYLNYISVLQKLYSKMFSLSIQTMAVQTGRARMLIEVRFLLKTEGVNISYGRLS